MKSVAAESPVRPELALGRTSQFDYDPPQPGSYELPVLKAAPDGEVLVANGEERRLRDLMGGRITVLSFIYLRCPSPKACPYATGVLRQLHAISEKDPAVADNMRLMTMSFDPEHDTPERMADYAALFQSKGAAAEWLFLSTASQSALQPILDDYGQVVDAKPAEGGGAGQFYHPVRVFLIDRQGQIRNIYSFAMLDPRLIMADVRTLLMEEKARARSAVGDARVGG